MKKSLLYQAIDSVKAQASKSSKTAVKFVPVTPAGTVIDWLASDTEEEAWKKLLKDAAHMPYVGIEGFKARGYTVEKM